MSNRTIILVIIIIGVVYMMLRTSKYFGFVRLMADAIQSHEGYYLPGTTHGGTYYPDGSISYQNNNPGNIRYVGQSLSTGEGAWGFAMYPTYEIGREDLERNIKNALAGLFGYSPDMTLYEFFAKYSPDGTSVAYAADVANRLGVTPDRTLKSIGA